MKESIRKAFWIFLVLVLVQACSCGLPGLLSTATPEVTTPSAPATQIPAAATSTPVLPAPAGVYPPPFATYHEAAVSLPQTFSGGGYSLPLDLNKVQGLDLVTLTATQRALLAQNGFAVAAPVPGQYREFYQIYEQNRYDEVPVFITTDSVYHVYHLIFDKMLRDLETGYFITDLKTLTTSMLAASTAQYQTLKGSSLGDPALRNAAYFAVADKLLGLSDPAPADADAMVNAELALINAASTQAI
jgi:hypothetical protein